MEQDFLKLKVKKIWYDERPFLVFTLIQLILLSALKIIFYYYNHSLLFSGEDFTHNTGSKFRMMGWSLFYDGITVLTVGFLFLISLQTARLLKNKVLILIVVAIFSLINSIILLLNAADVFYYRFHFQRLDADILFVTDHPFQLFFSQPYYIIVFIIVLFLFICTGTYRLHRYFYLNFQRGHRALFSGLFLLCTSLYFSFKKTVLIKILVPAYPLLNISSRELPAVQNSLHTFLYSVFREGQTIPVKKYFSASEADSIFPVIKHTYARDLVQKKNIVLFIMESAAYDFFDTASIYKVKMPFFDSLIPRSNFYTNAYSFGHESNKGIVSILAGQPTLTDIPLYHSPFINMPVTRAGAVLAKNGYQSFFCIGDQYDNFGFAECVHWLGINKYYCIDDIAADKDKPRHSMGMQDEYVLNFFAAKIKEATTAFFAINYNLSTHYPYDIPAAYSNSCPASYSAAMKAMAYYDHCMALFFKKIQSEKWFNNTVFIFCSDHWMQPGNDAKNMNSRNNFRIPIIIYDPLNADNKVHSNTVSQFDILGTVLNIGGANSDYISFGSDLLLPRQQPGAAFTRINANVYQVIDSNYVLGYNFMNEKTEYLFDFLKDKNLEKNLSNNADYLQKEELLEKSVKAFYQQTTVQYARKSFK